MNTNKLIKAKKTSKVKFLLAPRPQRDPLAADNDAPQHVLVPKPGTDLSKLADFDPQLFVSEQETKVGMLERAQTASKLLDPDLMKAMSKEFDYNDPNNIIDDDFMDQAGGLIEPEDAEMADLDDLFDEEPEIINFNDLHQEGQGDELDDECEDEDDDDFDEDDDKSFRDFISKQKRQDDNRSVFTGCSMSSSVMRRSQGLQQIDEHFERFYEDAYQDDTEIGALDLNEVKGEELLTNIDQISLLKKEVTEVRKRNHGDDYKPEIVSEHHKNAIIGDESEGEDLVEVEVERRENRIDCESILSYNSNLFNHPKLIVEPRKKTTSTRSNASDISMSTQDNTGASTLAANLAKLSVRPTNETPEERRARKKAIKELRSERRQERKQNQQVYKTEHAKLMKQQRSNMPALKLA